MRPFMAVDASASCPRSKRAAAPRWRAAVARRPPVPLRGSGRLPRAHGESPPRAQRAGRAGGSGARGRESPAPVSPPRRGGRHRACVAIDCAGRCACRHAARRPPHLPRPHQGVRRPPGLLRAVADHRRRRPRGAGGAERLGQVDAAADPRGNDGARRRRAHRAQGAARRLRAAGPGVRAGADGRAGGPRGGRWPPGDDRCRPGAAGGGRPRHRRLRRPRPGDRDALGRLAQAPGDRPGARASSPTCCCSTSRPTTSTSRRSSGWRSCSARWRRRSSW